ncbi:hypothetical protein KA005_46125 [bacterium]|nr:hypothetical protein [bacterium]
MSRIRDIINDLEGTCNWLDYDEITELELELLEEEIFCCSTCSWWCPIEEINEENVCTDCADEE